MLAHGLTEVICRDVGVVCFVLFSLYGLIGTMRVLRTSGAPPGPRPWALFAVFEMLEAVQVYGLLAEPAPRPEADIRSGAVVAVAALCFCAYLQRLYFVSVRNERRGFPRREFYTAGAIFIVLVIAVHEAGPYLP
jgi:hypothetical protein